ncbi:MAG: IMP dehydrogenase, partial [Nanoarchaeota archaeon]
FMPIGTQTEEAREIEKRSGKCYVAVGLQDYKERVTQLSPYTDLFMLDSANGSNILVENFIRWYKELDFPQDVVIGNTLTKASVSRVINLGADAMRHGIGIGCFTPEMKVKTETGPVKIKDVTVGTNVYTHTGKLQKVLEKFSEKRDEEIVVINNELKCTKNHEIYVINRKDSILVNEDNIQDYAKWIPAQNLTLEYMMIELDD